MKIEPNDKLVEFSKSELNLKEFHQDQPVSDFLRNEMEEAHQDFSRYMLEQHFDGVQSLLKEFIDDHHPREEKRKSLEINLFWWKIFYESSQEFDWNCADGFINENVHRFMDKEVLTSWLRKWENATTKFYYVGYQYCDHSFLMIDILDEQMLNVIIKDSKVVPPKQGEIVFGTLIPVGDGQYCPITDFYRFDYEARVAMGGTFRFYYDKFLQSNSLSDAFVHVLSVMLQIERRIFSKMQRAK